MLRVQSLEHLIARSGILVLCEDLSVEEFLLGKKWIEIMDDPVRGTITDEVALEVRMSEKTGKTCCNTDIFPNFIWLNHLTSTIIGGIEDNIGGLNGLPRSSVNYTDSQGFMHTI